MKVDILFEKKQNKKKQKQRRKLCLLFIAMETIPYKRTHNIIE